MHGSLPHDSAASMLSCTSFWAAASTIERAALLWRRLGNESLCGWRGEEAVRQAFPGAAVEKATGFLFVDAAPLFEKERHAGFETLFSYFCYPGLFHRPGAGAGFTTRHHPIDRGALRRSIEERPFLR